MKKDEDVESMTVEEGVDKKVNGVIAVFSSIEAKVTLSRISAGLTIAGPDL